MPARSKDGRWETKFARFIERYGGKELAKQLGVTLDSLYKWRDGRAHMRVWRALKIVELARDRNMRITVRQIYQKFDDACHQASNLHTRRK